MTCDTRHDSFSTGFQETKAFLPTQSSVGWNTLASDEFEPQVSSCSSSKQCSPLIQEASSVLKLPQILRTDPDVFPVLIYSLTGNPGQSPF